MAAVIELTYLSGAAARPFNVLMVKEGLGQARFGALAKLAASSMAGLAGSAENRYIPPTLRFSYTIAYWEWAPPGPALFYYLNGPGEMRSHGPARIDRSDGQLDPPAAWNSASKTAQKAPFDPGYDRSDAWFR
jgi:hypothetical protein